MSFVTTVGITEQERKSALELKYALESVRNPRPLNHAKIWALRPSNGKFLYALNPRSRIIWASAFVRGIASHFGLDGENVDPVEPMTFITLADVDCATTDQPQEIDFDKIRRRYQACLLGLNYLGMIEPAYYVNIAVGHPYEGRRMVCWHVHAIAWGGAPKQIKGHIGQSRSASKLQAIVDGLTPCHCKQVTRGELLPTIAYILKPPQNAYSIGKRTQIVGEQRRHNFQQNKRTMRPGERVKLATLMSDVYLDHLAVAGGEGSAILREIKYDALNAYRQSGQR